MRPRRQMNNPLAWLTLSSHVRPRIELHTRCVQATLPVANNKDV